MTSPLPPPHSLQAERAVLGAMMMDPVCVAMAAERITEACFYEANHRLVFDAMLSLFSDNQPVDTVTTCEKLQWRKQLTDAGGPAYVAALCSDLPTTVNTEHYIAILRGHWRMREMISALRRASEACKDPSTSSSVSDAIEEAERLVFEAAQETVAASFSSIVDMCVSRVTEIAEMVKRGDACSGISTGFKGIDAMTSGLHPGELILIAARPSMGKTAFATNVACNIAEKGVGVAIFSLEMTKNQLMDRVLVSMTGIDGQKLRQGRISNLEWARIPAVGARLKSMPLYVDDSSQLSPIEMRARFRRLKAQHPEVGVAMVDYIQLMRIPGFRDSREREVTDISSALKAMAKDFGIPVVALAQLNRESEKNTTKGVPQPPRLSNLRESGALEQDADAVFILFRPGFYTKDGSPQAQVIVEKQRNGPTGVVEMLYDGSLTTFTDAT